VIFLVEIVSDLEQEVLRNSTDRLKTTKKVLLPFPLCRWESQ